MREEEIRIITRNIDRECVKQNVDATTKYYYAPMIRIPRKEKLRQIHKCMCMMRAFESTSNRQTASESENISLW